MVAEQINDECDETHLIDKFFLGRQAILSRDQKMVGYKLLLRQTVLDPDDLNENFENNLTEAYIAGFMLDKLFGKSMGFVSVNPELLMSDAIHFFNGKNIVLEISAADMAVLGVADRIAELVQTGFTFALRVTGGDPEEGQKLLPAIHIIKIDISKLDESQLLQLCDFYKKNNKKLVAEHVQTPEQFELCARCGVDNFQGYFFTKSTGVQNTQISPSKLSIIHLMELINSDADNAEIESEIKRDVTIGLNLLRLVNTPAAGVPHQIESIHQALLILGRRQLQRWLQIMLYTKSGRGGAMAPPTPLLLLASTRGKLLELMAEKLKPGNHGMADMGFAIGIMSLMDRLFNLSMAELLKQISVVDDVSDALLYRKGFFGEALRLVEHIEQFEDRNFQLIQPLLEDLHLSAENFNRLQLIAFDWANQIALEV